MLKEKVPRHVFQEVAVTSSINFIWLDNETLFCILFKLTMQRNLWAHINQWEWKSQMELLFSLTSSSEMEKASDNGNACIMTSNTRSEQKEVPWQIGNLVNGKMLRTLCIMQKGGRKKKTALDIKLAQYNKLLNIQWGVHRRKANKFFKNSEVKGEKRWYTLLVSNIETANAFSSALRLSQFGANGFISNLWHLKCSLLALHVIFCHRRNMESTRAADIFTKHIWSEKVLKLYLPLALQEEAEANTNMYNTWTWEHFFDSSMYTIHKL